MISTKLLFVRIRSAPKRIICRWRSLPRIAAWAIVFAAWLLLGTGYLWPQDYRNTSELYVGVAWIGFLARAMQFYIGLGLVPIALIAAFITGRRLFLAALPPMVLGLWPCVSEIVFRPESPVPAQSAHLRVLTANVLCSNVEADQFLHLVEQNKPDVIVMQEYTPWWRDKTQVALSLEYPYSVGFPEADSSGIAICSKLPFEGPVRTDAVQGIDDRKSLRAVVKVGGRDVAIYTIHPKSPRSVDDYIGHRATFRSLQEAVSLEPLPCIIAGDCNLTETTPQHGELLKLGFVEAQAAVGHGRGTTWPMDGWKAHLFGIRLDHVYVRDGLVPVRCDVLDPGGSDHRPVFVELAVTGG